MLIVYRNETRVPMLRARVIVVFLKKKYINLSIVRLTGPLARLKHCRAIARCPAHYLQWPRQAIS